MALSLGNNMGTGNIYFNIIVNSNGFNKICVMDNGDRAIFLCELKYPGGTDAMVYLIVQDDVIYVDMATISFVGYDNDKITLNI